jgi:hypothetical protein
MMILYVLFDFTAHQYNLGQKAPKQERWFWLTSGVTNLKQPKGTKPPYLVKLRGV